MVEVASGVLILPESPSLIVSNGTNYSEAEVRSILQAIGGITEDLWTMAGTAAQALMQTRPTAYLEKVAPTLGQTEWNNATKVSEGATGAAPGLQEGHRTSEATNSASPVLGSSVVVNSDSDSSDIARRIVASDANNDSQSLELSQAEKQLFDEVGPQAIAQQMLVTAAQNSSPAIVQAIIDTYANMPDIQNGLITILQTYKIKVASAWWV